MDKSMDRVWVPTDTGSSPGYWETRVPAKPFGKRGEWLYVGDDKVLFKQSGKTETQASATSVQPEPNKPVDEWLKS